MVPRIAIHAAIGDAVGPRALGAARLVLLHPVGLLLLLLLRLAQQLQVALERGLLGPGRKGGRQSTQDNEGLHTESLTSPIGVCSGAQWSGRASGLEYRALKTAEVPPSLIKAFKKERP